MLEIPLSKKSFCYNMSGRSHNVVTIILFCIVFIHEKCNYIASI